MYAMGVMKAPLSIWSHPNVAGRAVLIQLSDISSRCSDPRVNRESGREPWGRSARQQVRV